MSEMNCTEAMAATARTTNASATTKDREARSRRAIEVPPIELPGMIFDRAI
jgi:hypothetical protein